MSSHQTWLIIWILPGNSIRLPSIYPELCTYFMPGPGGSDGEESDCSAGDLGSILGLGRSPGEGNGCLLQYSYLENPIGRGTWWATVHGVTKSRTWLSDQQTQWQPLNDGVQGHTAEVWLQRPGSPGRVNTTSSPVPLSWSLEIQRLSSATTCPLDRLPVCQ